MPTEEEIEATANAPKKTRTDEGFIEERDMVDVIRADQYNAGKKASGGPPYGMRIARTQPQGTVT